MNEKPTYLRITPTVSAGLLELPIDNYFYKKPENLLTTLRLCGTIRVKLNEGPELPDRKEIGMTLNQLKIGGSAVITSVGGEGALRCRLLDMGLTPRTRVTLRKVAPMGDPIEIQVRGYELTLRVDDASKITVRDDREEVRA